MAGYEVLLLDDGSDILQELAAMLEHEGVQVTLRPEHLAVQLSDRLISHYDVMVARAISPFTLLKKFFQKFKQVNPYGGVIVLSEDYHYTFPLEAFQLAIDDYLIMPGSALEVWRRLGICLEEVKFKYLRAFSDRPVSEVNIRALKSIRSSPLVRLSFWTEMKKTGLPSGKEPQSSLLIGSDIIS